MHLYAAAGRAQGETGFLFPPSLSNADGPEAAEWRRGVLRAADEYASGVMAEFDFSRGGNDSFCAPGCFG